MAVSLRKNILFLPLLIFLWMSFSAHKGNIWVAAFVDSCLKDPDAANSLCNYTAGNLAVRFCPRIQYGHYPGDDSLKEITCSTNKPANITISFNNKPLTGLAKVVNYGACNKTIQFTGKSMCLDGTYKCTTSDNAGTRIVKEARVSIQSTDFKFNFALENPQQEMILGTTANLSCSVSGADWKGLTIFNAPDFKFAHMDSQGNYPMISESWEIPKKYWYSPLEHNKKQNPSIFMRKLQVARINANDSRVYSCRIVSEHGRCILRRNVNVTTRPCRGGHYCLADSSEEHPCPAGTYNNNTGIFNRSSCSPCPRKFFCPEGSTTPMKCPTVNYAAVKKENIIPLPGATSQEDCQRCPMKKSCDDSYSTCKFLCATSLQIFGKEGNKVELKCRISEPALVKGLVWKKGSVVLVRNDGFDFYTAGDLFNLVINKANSDHSGTYRCEGTDTWMDQKTYASTELVVNKGDSNTVFWVIGIISVILLLALSGILFFKKRSSLRRYLQSTSSEKNMLDTISTVKVTEEFSADPVRQVHAASPLAESGDLVHTYDVFICYSSQDKDWVRKTLLNNLLDKNLRVCIDYRDFAPGAHIIKNVADAIDNSRKTIAVLSPDYVKSAWCNEELQMALGRIGDQHQVIPVMYRQCEVPRFLQQRTYLDWCNPDINPIFWDQLISSINDEQYLP